jgi:D-amino-acid oxidase
MLMRAVATVPELQKASVRRHRVGLRPARPAVRLETEQRDDATIVHCYGHGGSGVTLSWGCADDVLAVVRDLRL